VNTETKAIMVFAAIFIAGFSSGYLVNNAISLSSAEMYAEIQPVETINDEQSVGIEGNDRRERQNQRARTRLASHLELTEDQEEPFFEELSEYRSRLRSEMRDMRSRENDIVRTYYETLKNDLTTILNREQLEKLDTHLHPDSVRHHRMRGGRPGPNR
jgi:hypothetical protein